MSIDTSLPPSNGSTEIYGPPAPEQIGQQERIPFDGVVREPTPEDMKAIRPILETWVRDPDTGEVVTAEVDGILAMIMHHLPGDKDRRYLVAETAGRDVVGIMGSKTPDEDRMKELAKTENPVEFINAFGNPAWKGVGEALATALEQRARADGATEILVNSGPRYKDTGGWRFWTRQYGEPITDLIDFYGPGRDAKAWRKELI
jgi:hypothetical protein